MFFSASKVRKYWPALACTGLHWPGLQVKHSAVNAVAVPAVLDILAFDQIEPNDVHMLHGS